jgi:SAM-dependent methyltransferase
MNLKPEKTPVARLAFKPLVSLPPVLDVTCGVRGMWFNKQDSRALFVDQRAETVVEVHKGERDWVSYVAPDHVADFTNLPFPDESFSLVVFDPPHVARRAPKGNITKRFGHLTEGWRQILSEGFAECFRVLKPQGVLVFKWSAIQFPLSEILSLTDHAPLFGHQSGKASNTHWVCFLKG